MVVVMLFLYVGAAELFFFYFTCSVERIHQGPFGVLAWLITSWCSRVIEFQKSVYKGSCGIYYSVHGAADSAVSLIWVRMYTWRCLQQLVV